LVTAFLSDLAEMFGCLVDLPDIVTAAVFVALGTSVPDLFASIGAAVDSPDADAAIVNVTGSNAVNVFLGLGIPWVCSAVYWTFYGERDADWVGRYPVVAGKAQYDGTTVFVVESANLAFYVFVFTVLSILALLLLVMRRQCLGAELGGPVVPKYLSSTLLVCMWLVFVCVTSWKVLRCDGAASDDYCAAPIEEQMAVLALLGGVLMSIGVPTVIATCVAGKQARADMRGEPASSDEVEKSEQVDIKVTDSEVMPDTAVDVTKADPADTASDQLKATKQELEWFSSGSRRSGASGGSRGVQSLQPSLVVRPKPCLTRSRSTVSGTSKNSPNSGDVGSNLPVEAMQQLAATRICPTPSAQEP